jgi:hypothetical protein
MGEDNLRSVIFRKISNFLLDYPEISLFLKIVCGAILLGIGFLIINNFLMR